MPFRLIIICCLLPFSRLFAQETVRAFFDSSEVETGEAFQLHVITENKPATIDLSAWDSLLPQSQIIKRSEWYNTGQIWQMDITYIAFDPAQLSLPPITIRFRDGSGALSNPTQLTIVATPVPSTDLNDMADIKNIHKEEENWTDKIWIAWVLGGLLIIGLLIFWLTRRKKKPAPLTRIQTNFYRETALEKLNQLEKQELWQNGRIKDYYAGISYIVREFIGAHFRVKALESTTEEMTTLIGRMNISDELKQAMITLLTNADLAKFAKGLPETSYHPVAMADARRFISNFQPLHSQQH